MAWCGRKPTVQPDVDLTEADKECHVKTQFSLQQVKDMRLK